MCYNKTSTNVLHIWILFPNTKSLDGCKTVFEIFMEVKIYVAINRVEDGRHHIGSDDMYDQPRKDKKE
jgi:hypothetical protein